MAVTKEMTRVDWRSGRPRCQFLLSPLWNHAGCIQDPVPAECSFLACILRQALLESVADQKLCPTHCWQVASRDLCLLPIMPMHMAALYSWHLSSSPRSQSGDRALSWPACNKAIGLPIVMLAALPIPCGAHTLGRLSTAGQVAVGIDSSHHWLPGWQGWSHSVPLQVLVPESFLVPSQTWNLLQKMAANEH